MLPLRVLLACTLIAFAASLPAEDKKPAAPDADFKPLFNGKDLTGWVFVNTHPDTFFVKDGEIITTGSPMGFLRTEKQYENFVLEMDWMHINKKEVGNSGLFVWGDPLPAVGTVYTRGIEVQILVNYPNVGWATNHGDLFSIWGAKCTPDRPHPKGYERCLPSEERCKGGGEWNHYKVTANDGSIKLEVNGKEVSGVSKCNPRKGYLALESEGAECHFKNIKIKELPSTNPKQEEIAKVSEGHTSLFNARDLTGWRTEDNAWKVAGGKLIAQGTQELNRGKARVAHGELMFDWKLPAKSSGQFGSHFGPVKVVTDANGTLTLNQLEDKPDGKVGSRTDTGKAQKLKLGAWNRTVVTATAQKITITVNGEEVIGVPATKRTPAAAVAFVPTEGLEIMNVFFRELNEEKR
jgi:hypothetical protein